MSARGHRQHHHRRRHGRRSTLAALVASVASVDAFGTTAVVLPQQLRVRHHGGVRYDSLATLPSTEWHRPSPLVLIALARRRGDASEGGDDDIRARARRILEGEADASIADAEAGEGRAKGAIAGAVIGGFLGGPLGLLLGANVGASMSSGTSAAQRSYRAKLEALGVDADVLRQVEDVANDVRECEAAVQAADDARASAASFVATLRRDRDAAQDAAENAVRAGDDETARTYLRSRISLDERVARAESDLTEAETRVDRAKEGLEFFKTRADDLDDLVARTVVAFDAKRRGLDDEGTSLLRDAGPAPVDPLLEKFKALEAENKRKKGDAGV
mmetsp:Transcript_23925/g.94924  ORF Transcript_23925/g.94924 Transcript_23925/m.94924 type:complete len:332 (-) Transcript_23925:866-1861(-)